MLTLQNIIEVVTDGPVQPGSVAHRRATHSWATTVREHGRDNVTRHTVPVPACERQTADAPATMLDGRAYSGGWALERGATPCLAEACFPGGAA